MDEWTNTDKFLFVLFVIIPPIAIEWWLFHINAIDELYQVFLLPLLVAGNGFIIWFTVTKRD